ncbi:hypothetical protein Tco_1126184 [Tanacetum coccineum]
MHTALDSVLNEYGSKLARDDQYKSNIKLDVFDIIVLLAVLTVFDPEREKDSLRLRFLAVAFVTPEVFDIMFYWQFNGFMNREGFVAVEVLRVAFVTPVSKKDDRRGIRMCLTAEKQQKIGVVGAEERRRVISEVGYGIRDTWVDLAEAVPEIAPTTLGEVNTRFTELAEPHKRDTQDLYALLEDAQDGRTRISQRVAMDSQRVDLLMRDRMTLQETIWIIEEEAYASREAWAHSI